MLIVTTLIVLSTLLFGTPGDVFAETASPSATAATSTPSATPTTTDSIKTRIEESALEKPELIDQIIKTAKSRLETRKEEFQKKLQTLKDEKKKTTLQRLVGKFDTINSKWVEHWKKILGNLTEILDKIDARSKVAEANGVDISAYLESSNEAKAKIDAAYSALEEQAGNSYVFDITTEGRLGTEVKSVTGQFKTDVQKTHEAVKAAREAVHSSLALLKELKGKNE